MKLPKWMDKCWRYVWSNRNVEPLRQMQARGENMYDVRARLGVKMCNGRLRREC